MARAAFKNGAMDYITKPWSNDELLAQVAQAVESRRLRDENVQLKRALKQRFNFPNIVGKSDKMQVLTRPRNAGRAFALHHSHQRRKRHGQGAHCQGHSFRFDSRGQGLCARQYRIDSCRSPGVPALRPCQGRFSPARLLPRRASFEVRRSRQPFFFDEIATISPETQAKLLRVIQEREFMRLGGTEQLKVDVRNRGRFQCRPPHARCARGRFREDFVPTA